MDDYLKRKKNETMYNDSYLVANLIFTVILGFWFYLYYYYYVKPVTKLTRKVKDQKREGR